ncbi:AMP-binding protein, partial [Streptomyces xiamenensis]|uniref:non-ribosomal peptide synthetase n=1 Tax=Streptomyces xiamenensis TaxID=408015 RepID=UPI0036EBAC1F
RVPADVHERLVGLARSSRASVFMVVQSALAVLLSRLGAGDDIPIGTPASARDDEVLDQLVGFFVNTLVLRSDVSGNPTFSELVQRVRTANLDAYAHQDVPFERLVEELNPLRSLGWNPLFQVLLDVNGQPAPALALPDVEARHVPLADRGAKVDLTFLLNEEHDEAGRPAGMSGVLEYAVDLFDPETAQTLAERFIRVLEWAAADGGARVGDAEILSPRERTLLLAERNDTDRPAPWPHTSIPDWFARNVRRGPDAIAVEAGTGSLTYAALDEESERLAQRLRALGVGPEDRVAILMERSVGLVVSSLAVLKAGGAYVPLYEDSPRTRIRDVMAATSAKVLLTTSAMRSRCPETDARVLVLDEPAPTVRTGGRPLPVVHPEGLACILYTSGSTGQPKGVAITHRDIMTLLTDPRWRAGRQDGVLLRSPHAFDASNYELWVPLLSGGRIVLAPKGRVDLEELAPILRGGRATGAFLTTSLFNALVSDHLDSLGGVREVLTGGEAASPAAIRAAHAAHPDLSIVNVYGPTETTTYATMHTIDPGEPISGDSVPIGVPLPNTRVYVLDRFLGVVPPGVVGELY